MALIQNERDIQKSERRRKDRSRRWSWIRSSSSGAEPEQQNQQQQKKRAQSAQDQGKVSRYQVPLDDAMQQYQTLVDDSNDDDASGDNLSNDNIDASGSRSSDPHHLDRRQSCLRGSLAVVVRGAFWALPV